MRDYAYHARMSVRTKVLNAFRSVFRIGVAERWLRSRTEGSPRGSFWVRMMPPEYGYPKGSWRSIERDGLKYHLDISNATDHAEYFGYRDEGEEHLAELIRPDHTIVDIGGNIGVRALHFARKVPLGRVITIEPDPDTFARLQEHLRLNGHLRNITALNLGIGPKEAVMKLYQVVPSNSGMNRIITRGEGLERFPHKEVRIATLAAALDGTGAQHVDMIKIDVEGFEQGVLEGSEPIIRRDRPVLFVELDDDNLRENGTSARSLIRYIGELGYEVLDSTTLRSIGPERELAHCHFDVLCRPVAR